MKKLILILMLLLLTSPILAQEDQPLLVTISAGKRVYEVGEDIILAVNIHSKSNKKVLAFWNSGKMGIRQEEIGVVEAFMIGADYLEIGPSETINKKVVLKNDLAPLSYPYRLSFGWRCLPPLGIDIDLASDTVLCPNGAVVSNTINIQIVDHGPSSMGMSKAKEVAEEFLSHQTYKNAYREKASSIKEYDDYVDVFFARIIPAPTKGDGLVRVYKKEWNAQWIPSL